MADFDLGRAVLLCSGVLMVVLGVAILLAGAQRPIHRAFACLVTLRGIVLGMREVSTSPEWAWATVQAQPYFVLALVPVTLACMVTLWRPAHGRQAWWGALGLTAVLDLLYALDHDLFHSLASGTSEIGAMRAGRGIVYTAFGPLSALGALVPVLLGALALVAVLTYRRQRDLGNATTVFLLASGLMLGALFDAANRLVSLSELVGEPGYPWLPWGWAVQILPVVTVFPAALCAVLIGLGPAHETMRSHGNLMLALAGAAFSAGFLRLMLTPDSDPGGQSVVLILLGLSRLLMPALLAVAFLRKGSRPWLAGKPSTDAT